MQHSFELFRHYCISNDIMTFQRRMEGEFTVEASDMVRIILGFLTAQGLHESAKVLRKESGIGFTNGVIQKRKWTLRRWRFLCQERRNTTTRWNGGS
jgi:hypothetical protein